MCALALPCYAALTLSAPQPFLLPDATIDISVRDGQPGARFVVLASSTPASFAVGQLGTLYLAPGTFQVLGAGFLDAQGEGTASLPVPDTVEDGDRLYLQALELGAERRFSENSVALRRQS
ncbi:MAG: hypothetical protein AAF184_09055, partial [Pseudomonadota bacterium]